jgi:benzil reductase ((S)-benzoin forming)
LAPTFITSTCVRYVRERNLHLHLLNISSGAATKAIAGWGAYCSTKAAARMYFDVLASDGSSNILVEHFDPGVLDTKMQSAIRNANSQCFPMQDDFIQMHIQGKLKSPLAVAQQVEAMIFAEDRI